MAENKKSRSSSNGGSAATPPAASATAANALRGASSSMSVDELDRLAGARIKLARKAVRMTQTELGEKIGVSFQQVQKYEKGANRIGAGALFQISRILGMSVHEIFGELPPHAAPAAPQQLGEGKNELASGYLRSRYMAESIELLAAFDKIPNVKMREQIIELAKTLASTFNKGSIKL